MKFVMLNDVLINVELIESASPDPYGRSRCIVKCKDGITWTVEDDKCKQTHKAILNATKGK